MRERLVYKVVELSAVTDEDIEMVINKWVAEGWHFDTVLFAMRDASKRPSMAFVFFTKNEAKKPDAEQRTE